jgi:hypothetical protein
MQQNKNELFEQIHSQVFSSIQNGYHGKLQMLQLASCLAMMPNWRETLESEYEVFLSNAKIQGDAMKNDISGQMQPDVMIESRTAVASAVDKSVQMTQLNLEALVSTIEQLLGISQPVVPSLHETNPDGSTCGVILTEG